MNKINIKHNSLDPHIKSNNSLKPPPPNFITSLGAFIFYILVILIIIPILLIKSNKKQFLLLYYPNVDLFATLLSFNGGLPGNQFQNLYTNEPDTRFSQISTLFINYIALLGVTFLIAKHTLDKKNIYKGWSIGFVILFTTYIFPSFFLQNTLDYIYYNLFSKNKNIKSYYQEYDLVSIKQRYIKYIPTLIIGILIVYGLIILELRILKNFKILRTEVTKRLIKYIKEKDLSRSNKINLDSRLKKLINEDEVTYFTIQKEMNKHYL